MAEQLHIILVYLRNEEVRGLNLTVFTTGDNVFRSCECIKGYTFKMVASRGKSARLTATFAQLQDKSVYSTVLNASRHINAS